MTGWLTGFRTDANGPRRCRHYADLRNDDPDLDQIEQAAAGKLTSFPALTRDIYQM